LKKDLYNNIDAIYSIEESSARRRGINSVEIGIRVLDAIMSLRQPSALKTIAEAAEMDTSQAHRYVSSLLNSGIIKQENATGLYDLGPKALHIGLAEMARLDPITIASDSLKEFSLTKGYTCILSVWGSLGPTIIRWFNGSPPVFTTLAIGSVLPVFTSSTGRVFMSFLDEPFLVPFLEEAGLKTPLDKNTALRADRKEIQSSGIGGVDSTVIPGLRAYASPVFGIENSLIGVCTVLLSDANAKSKDRKLKPELLRHCCDVTKKLGGNWPIST
jgi:DNA-binding IclR family transcriptional regulator